MNSASRVRLAVDLVLCVAVVTAATVVCRAVWHALTTAGRDAVASVARHRAHRDALARASMPRSLP